MRIAMRAAMLAILTAHVASPVTHVAIPRKRCTGPSARRSLSDAFGYRYDQKAMQNCADKSAMVVMPR